MVKASSSPSVVNNCHPTLLPAQTFSRTQHTTSKGRWDKTHASGKDSTPKMHLKSATLKKTQNEIMLVIEVPLETVKTISMSKKCTRLQLIRHLSQLHQNETLFLRPTEDARRNLLLHSGELLLGSGELAVQCSLVMSRGTSRVFSRAHTRWPDMPGPRRDLHFFKFRCLGK